MASSWPSSRGRATGTRKGPSSTSRRSSRASARPADARTRASPSPSTQALSRSGRARYQVAVEAARAVLSTPAAWLLLGGGYLAGSIPFGFMLALLVGKKDVRLSGSGNIGATNVARVVGKKLGIVTLVLDAAKGAIPVMIAGQVVF